MFSVRQATEVDIALIHELARAVFPHTYRDMIPPEQIAFMMDWMYAPANIRQQMRDGHVYLLLSRDGVPCGYASLSQECERDSVTLFHLHKIYILPACQGAGAGRYLFGEVIKYIRSHCAGPCAVELNVNRNNPAVNFYRRQGMVIDRQGDFAIGSGFYMNDYIMKLVL